MEMISSLLILAGAFFFLVSALGVLKFPDFYSRTHAASKASSLGMALVLGGVAIHFPQWEVFLKCILIVFFIFLTAPIGAHILARAARRMKIPEWRKK